MRRQRLELTTGHGTVSLAIRIADRFASRLRGLLGRPEPGPREGLLITRCASVHTWGMRYAIDVVFLGDEGRIRKCIPHLRPWRAAACPGARHVLELPAGSVADLGLRPGLLLQLPSRSADGSATDPRPGNATGRQKGAAMIEFLVAGPVLTLLGLTILQYGMLFFAKNNINHATFMAARAGSTGHADLGVIRTAYARALIPAYGGGRSALQLAAAYAKANADVSEHTRIELLNPTKECFDDWSVPALTNTVGGGRRTIPNANIGYRNPDAIGAKSGQDIQDANLIKIRVTHGYKPKIPLAGPLMIFLLKWYDDRADNFQTNLYKAGRIPVVSHATLKMESEAIEGDKPVSLPGPGNNGRPGDPGEPASGGKEPPDCQTVGCTTPPGNCDPATDPAGCQPAGCQAGDPGCDPACQTSCCTGGQDSSTTSGAPAGGPQK